MTFHSEWYYGGWYYGVYGVLTVNHHGLVSPTLNVNLTMLVVPCKVIWALQIYNVASIVTY